MQFSLLPQGALAKIIIVAFTTIGNINHSGQLLKQQFKQKCQLFGLDLVK